MHVVTTVQQAFILKHHILAPQQRGAEGIWDCEEKVTSKVHHLPQFWLFYSPMAQFFLLEDNIVFDMKRKGWCAAIFPVNCMRSFISNQNWKKKNNTYVTVRSKIKISQAAADLAEKTKGLFLNSENVTHALKVSACSFYAWLWPALTWTQRLCNIVFYTTAK